jgi:nitroimidazol reductase NimA-like FMN-containing flavoprotein (pyridoxamine 5'-phosphate oxidase superfamily)
LPNSFQQYKIKSENLYYHHKGADSYISSTTLCQSLCSKGHIQAYKYKIFLFELLLDNISFSDSEIDFLGRNEACRIATCHNGIPHVAPVSYIFENGFFFIATDYETRKFENIKRNKAAALVVDIYSSVGNSAVCVQGTAEPIERGQEFTRLYKKFHERFEWVRRDPWKEGEAPFVRITPTNKVSWGLE